MPIPKLDNSINKANSQLSKLDIYRIESQQLDAKYQHLVSEIIMLRLFTVFEECVADIAYKLAAGATYINGNTPNIITQASTVSASRGLFLSYGRSKPVQNLKWTKSRYIKESVCNVIPITEPYILKAQIHGAIIDEMRKVRNGLAHNTSTAKQDFKEIIRQTYGANITISIGAFLSSTRRTPISNLSRYIASTRIVLKDLANG